MSFLELRDRRAKGQNRTKTANTLAHISVRLKQRGSSSSARGEVHTHAQRLVLTIVVAEKSEFEMRIGTMSMLQYRDHHVPRMVIFTVLSVAPLQSGMGL